MLKVGPNKGADIIVKINKMYTENDETKASLPFLMRV